MDQESGEVLTKEKELTDSFEIVTLQQLGSLLENLQLEFLNTGILIELPGEISVKKLLNSYLKKTAFPDIVNISFRHSKTGDLYELNCDLYHGRGGFGKVKLPDTEIKNFAQLEDILKNLKNKYLETGLFTQLTGKYSVNELLDQLKVNKGLKEDVTLTFRYSKNDRRYYLNCDINGKGIFEGL